MSRATALLNLQAIDSELDVRRARLKAVDEMLSDSPEVRAAQQDVVAAQAQFTAARIALQSFELDNQAVSEKIAESEGRLYGGRVTNPKELRDLEMEVAALKRQRAAVEEQQLDALIQAETTEARFVVAQTDLQRAEAAAAKTAGNLLEERGQLHSRIERLEDEREAALASVAAEDQQLYERLRRTKNGRAVARLEDGVCAACGVAPSSSRIQSVRQGNELIRCGNCDRILCAE